MDKYKKCTPGCTCGCKEGIVTLSLDRVRELERIEAEHKELSKKNVVQICVHINKCWSAPNPKEFVTNIVTNAPKSLEDFEKQLATILKPYEDISQPLNEAKKEMEWYKKDLTTARCDNRNHDEEIKRWNKLSWFRKLFVPIPRRVEEI